MILINKNFIDIDTVNKMYRHTQDATDWAWCTRFDQNHAQFWLDADEQFQEVIDACGMTNPQAVISGIRRTQDTGPYQISKGRVCAVMLNNDYQSNFGGGLQIGQSHYDIEPGTVIRYENQIQQEFAPQQINVVQTILYVYE
jgi:hypothetical protein